MTQGQRLCAFTGLALLSLSLSTRAEAQLPADPFAKDGWYRWEVQAVSEAKDWCCYSSHGGGHGSQRTACNLDGEKSHYVAPKQTMELEDTMQIFAKVSGDQISRIKVVSSGCSVRSRSPWTDLGQASTDKSLEWLTAGTHSEKNFPDGWLTAVAVTKGPKSHELLEEIALNSDHHQQREQAIFWMGQLRFEETRHTLLEIMNNDPDQSVREQAIFSLSQSPAGDRLALLIGLVEDANRPMTDRKRALFWLAQADDGEGVDYIQSLLLRP